MILAQFMNAVCDWLVVCYLPLWWLVCVVPPLVPKVRVKRSRRKKQNGVVHLDEGPPGHKGAFRLAREWAWWSSDLLWVRAYGQDDLLLVLSKENMNTQLVKKETALSQLVPSFLMFIANLCCELFNPKIIWYFSSDLEASSSEALHNTTIPTTNPR